MSRFFYAHEIAKPEDVIPHLARQERHWKKGYSAYELDLRTPGRRSQTDLLAFVKFVHGAAVIAVEGKVEESFRDLVSTWNDHSPGKERRLEALCASLGLRVADVGGIRYQLLHRTASAIYEAQRYRTSRAVMLVHSFSATDASFRDFQAFAKSMRVPVQAVNRMSEEQGSGFGWRGSGIARPRRATNAATTSRRCRTVSRASFRDRAVS